MNNNPPQTRLSRRDFLKIMGAAGATVMGGYILSETVPWMNYDKQVETTWAGVAERV